MGAFVETRTVVSMEVPRLRTRPPVEADGCFLWRHLSPQRTTGGVRTGVSISGMKEVGMTQEMILGMAAFVVSIGAVLYVRLRRPAYVMVRRSSREHPRVR